MNSKRGHLMQYIKCKWKHDFSEEPTLLYMELDEERWELRKIELFDSGRVRFASKGDAMADRVLSLGPVPDITFINSDPQFEAVEISEEEFEAEWANAVQGN